MGRVAIRERGSFNVETKKGSVKGVSYKNCKVVSRSDGYRYFLSHSFTKKGEGASTVA